MLRLVDANIDRIGEGLRVLEDVARFILDDATLSSRLKFMRHELVADEALLQEQLLTARHSDRDVGAFAEVAEEERKDIPEVVMANARRVQESLRVMEEFAKLSELALDSTKYNRARFDLYELEQVLISKLLRNDRKSRLKGLYVIIDTEALKGRDEVDVAMKAIRGGSRVIQLREKHHNGKQLLEVAQRIKKVCDEGETLFIVNDYLDIALACNADGIHLGQSDLPVADARRLLPHDKLIGCSATTVPLALKAESDGADYIAVGSIYPTNSKERFTLVGPEILRQIKQAVSLPVVAIGGINQSNVKQVVGAGADGVAVISAVLEADDVEEAARRLAEAFRGGEN
jgi:thiamine-phosphate pyrophosphorylase